MAAPPAKTNLRLGGLALRLVQERLVSEEAVLQALDESTKNQTPLISHLVQANLVKSRDVAAIASLEFGVPLFDLSVLDTDTAPIALVEEKLIRGHHALPLFKRGNRLFVGVSDPTKLQGLDEIKFHTGLATEAVVVEEDKLTRLIDTAMRAQETSISDMMGGDLDNMDVDFADEGGGQRGEGGAIEADADDAPVVKFANKVLLDAINTGASDIHIEPYEKGMRIRFRQDGILRVVAEPPLALAGRLTARFKVMSRMNLAERRVPQDGRIKLKLSKNRAIDFRVNTLPTLFGEKICLRILDPTSATVGVEQLGFEPEQKEAFLKAIHKPYGMILVTGPTGSGKTVTLYTGLNLLNTPEINISTAEDPVEINMYGINQCNVNNAVGLTFAAALKSFLRQDPDIVMVGEIRDMETGEIAVKAAQTGHLVLSTLHTNDAPQTLTRLINMGIPPFNIASSVLLIMAQRLARRLCTNCKAPVDIPKEALLEEGFTEEEVAEGLTIYGPVGCERCNNGYKGRVGLFQVMPISDAMGRMIMEGTTSVALADQAQVEGIKDLRQAGLKKVKDGFTSLQELNRVTKE